MLSHICQFHLPHLQMLQARGDTVHVAAYDNLAVKNGLKLQYCDQFIPIPFARSPKSPQNIRAYRMLRALLEREHYDVIVCNTPVGGVITRLAAKKARKRGTRVIYIAHGFHFYKGAPKSGWLVYYPIERHMAQYCDTLVTINEEDYAFAASHFKNTAVAHIHGVGVRSERYHPASAAECLAMRRREGLTEDDFVILCTGELNKNKDQSTLIAAAAKLKSQLPHLRVLLSGNGPMEADLRAQVAALHLEQTVRFLGYRTDLENVVPCVDAVVSCSHREGLGLNVIEAMLCKKPVVASCNRGHRELIADGTTGFLFPPGAADVLAAKIGVLSTAPALAQKMGEAGYKNAQKYTVCCVISEVSTLI